MEQYRQLSSHGNHRSLLGIFSSSLRKLPSPSPQITVFSKRPQNVVRSLHHHRSQIPVSCFTDFLLRLALPGVPPARFQSQKTTYLATLQKPVWLHRFRCRRHFLFQNDFACFIQNTVERPAISQIHTDRQLLVLENFALECLYSANLLHSRSPFLVP